MKLYLRLILSLCAVAMLFPNMVSALTVSEVQEKMAQSDADLRTLQFQYVQKMHSNLSKEVRQSSGTAYFRKPNQLRIEQKSPEVQIVVASGKFVSIYTPRFHQVIQQPWDQYFADQTFFPGVAGFNRTLQKLKEGYLWKIEGTPDLNGEKTIALQLTKKDGQDQSWGQLILWIGESDFIPRKTELVSGTLTLTTTLTAFRKNPELEGGLFKFKAPPGSETIKMP